MEYMTARAQPTPKAKPRKKPMAADQVKPIASESIGQSLRRFSIVLKEVSGRPELREQ